jgi:hypothetical protein
MKGLIAVLFYLIAMQIVFDCFIADKIIHGEVAWEWACDERHCR